MSEEIKEILDRLENCDNYKYRNDNGLSYKEIEGWEIDLLLDYITNLQKENTKLKELCDKYEEEHNTTFEEWKKDINIIDGLEKYINEVNNMITTRDIKENMYICGRYDENLDILDKLNKLKGDNK